MSRKLNPKQATAYLEEVWGLAYSTRTLANFRVSTAHGTGPRYFRPAPNRVLYDQADVDDWARAKLGEPADNTAQERNVHGRTFPGAPDATLGTGTAA
jgi:hypothetical protein